MKTYAETQNKPPFDWNAFLEAKIEGRDFPSEASPALLSAGWVTCACGVQCAAIPRYLGGTPKDNILANLGGNFHGFICLREWKAARYTLAAIEARSAQLLKEMAQ